jgi:hypothetical protein
MSAADGIGWVEPEFGKSVRSAIVHSCESLAGICIQAPDQSVVHVHDELLLFHLGSTVSSSVLDTSYENSVVVKVLSGYMIKMSRYET